jgi:hypothetical protein
MTPDEIAKLIPEEVVQKARVAWLESASDYTRLDESIRAALAAGLAVWPGMSVAPIPRLRPYKEAETLQHIILPLQETQNAE